MRGQGSAGLTLRVEIEKWPLKAPFCIAGYTTIFLEVVVVALEKGGCIGQGEATSVFYLGDDATSIVRQVENVRTVIETGIDRSSLQKLMPPGSARNAIDCALWELDAKLSGIPVWKLAALEKPRPLLTTFTCGADLPERMVETACAYTQARAIKLKLTGELPIDAERVLKVRKARPDVWLGVDANQSYTIGSMARLLPILEDAQVALIEQPFPIAHDFLLDDLQSPIPIAADESAQSILDIPGLVGRFDVVNIKLDKCGGLTEALEMVRAARKVGLQTMIGNMLGTSLAMAPAFLVGQLCNIVDLDGPIFLTSDRLESAKYDNDGYVTCPAPVWGNIDRIVCA